MEKFVIDGGVPLRGTITPAGNKNAALPILAASVLTSEEVLVRNVPRIRDVDAMLRVLRGLGASAEWRDDNEVVICAAGVDHDVTVGHDIDADAVVVPAGRRHRNDRPSDRQRRRRDGLKAHCL